MKKAFLLVLVSFILMAITIPEKLDKKINKTIASYFETEEFSKEIIPFTKEQLQDLPADLNERLYKIQDASSLLGYAYVGNAPSKTATFDYLVLFDKDFIIIKSKVVTYREEYGGEIGSKRWLKQFIGKSSKSQKLEPSKNISVISGATISVRSMTRAINNVLLSIGDLQKDSVL